jgi:hypothetical protein
MKIESKAFGIILLSVAGLAVILFTFSIGVFIGSKKAEFSFRWAEQYHKNFAGPKEGFLGQVMGREFMEASGTFGHIVNIGEPNAQGQVLIITQDARDNKEMNILVDQKTSVTYLKNNIKLSDLKINDNIIIIGQPNADGQIEARLIRVMPQKVNLKFEIFNLKSI